MFALCFSIVLGDIKSFSEISLVLYPLHNNWMISFSLFVKLKSVRLVFSLKQFSTDSELLPMVSVTKASSWEKWIIIIYCPFIILDRKSTRLNSSHVKISYAVFCLKKKI